MNIWRKIALYSLGSACIFVSSFSASQATFLEEMDTMGIDTTALQGQKGVSRYEITRLLNASECKDCLHPAQTSIDKYTLLFRTTFAATPGKDFGDISYLQALAEENNYYYCVAYIGEQNYMRGYPKSTSPICAGRFCGQQLTTKAEFIQIIVNLLSKYLYEGTQMPWKAANQRIQKLKIDSYEAKSFTTEEKNIINEESKRCDKDVCYLTTANHMQLYLKYCMFNLSSCGMQVFEGLKQGYWPVAEVNMLYKQNIITLNEDLRKKSYEIVDGKTVLAILSNVYNKIQCSFNDDYDCDSIINKDDNCPNDYNPHQKDTDKDNVGDVCSRDVDGDKINNPINIVDDTNRINIRVLQGRTGQLDNCLYTQNTNQEDRDNNGIGDLCDQNNKAYGLSIAIDKVEGIAPLKIEFKAIGEGISENIQRDFGDGQQSKGLKTTHTFLLPGTYRIQAVEKTGNQVLKAQNIIIVGGQREKQTALQAKANSIGSKETKEFIFNASAIGDVDTIVRSFSDTDQSKKTPQETVRKLLPPGQYTVTLKANKGNEIQAISMFTLAVGENKGSMLKSSFLNPDTKQKTDFQTEMFGFSQDDIAYVQWDFGDGTLITNQDLATSHTYTQGGKRAVVQKIYFTDGTQLTNIITLYSIDKTLLRSYALTLHAEKFVGNVGETISFISKIVGDNVLGTSTFVQRFSNEKSETINKEIAFPIKKQYSYTESNLYYPESDLFINQCTYLKAQASIYIQGEDSCLQAKKDGSLLRKYRCDKDKDKIPDVCDDDIDGDGIKNTIGIITHEQTNCLIDKNNIDEALIQNQGRGICSLDNAPFDANPQQEDLNGDYIGDANTIPFTIEKTQKDADGDGIPDDSDLCPYIHGMGSPNGCPEIDETCGTNATDASDQAPILSLECNQCPCQYTDFIQNLTNGDQVKAVLRDKEKKVLYNYSLPRIVNF